MDIIYQLSREACPSCRAVKKYITDLKDPKFEYRYIDIDKPIEKGTIVEEILNKARLRNIKSLPIIAVAKFEDNVEYFDNFILLNSETFLKIDELNSSKEIESK